MNRILIIHNPVSGGKKNRFLNELRNIEGYQGWIDIKTSQYPGHIHELAKAAIGHYQAVVAAGGDGTVNEIASALKGSSTPMGIIPYGSGNGFANYLKVPKRLSVGLERIRRTSPKSVDTLQIKDHVFINIAGVGYDGHIAQLFNQGNIRGMVSYAWLTLREFIRFKSFKFTLKIDEEEQSGEAFIILFANSSQYGNNFYIAPGANAEDGLIHVYVIRKPPLYKLPWLMKLVYDNKTLKTGYCTKYTGKAVSIETSRQPYHIDGETPSPMPDGNVEVSIHPKTLWVYGGKD